MKYEYWFAGIRNIPDRTKIKLKEKAGTAEAIYYIEETALRKMQLLKEQEIWKLLEAKKKEELDRNYEAMRQKGISVIPWGEKEYPGRLKEIYDPPYALYVKGKLPDNTARAAAIVGARSCTPYGEKYALEYGKKLAECGIQVISGLARGVDGIGQRGALLGGGKTFAVLGSGVDVCYPKNHMGLYLDILEQEGGILSELPPGTPPLPQHFPRRNRIISALSDIVLVMEARERSGSLITAKQNLIFSMRSSSCGQLLVFLFGFLFQINRIQISLQDKNSCDLVNILLSVLAPHLTLDQCTLCLHGSKPLVPHHHIKSCPAHQHLFEFQRLFCTFTHIVIHMLRKTKHDRIHFIFPYQLFNPGECTAQLVFLFSLNGLYPLRSQTKSIADRNPYSLRAIIQSHDPHSRLFP